MPSIETIEKICEAFGMTLSQFFAEGNLIEVDEELKELLDMPVNTVGLKQKGKEKG